jgi:hypothetical protein
MVSCLLMGSAISDEMLRDLHERLSAGLYLGVEDLDD